MKKLIVSAFSLGLALTATTVYASNNNVNTVIAANSNEDGKVTVKPEELPEPVKKTLSGEEYKGWLVKEASLVTAANVSHYEVSLSNDKDTKIVKLDKEGAVIK